MSNYIAIPNYTNDVIKTPFYDTSAVLTPYQPQQTIRIPLEEKPAMILEDLINVDTSILDKTSNNTTKNYVLVYDGVTGKYKFVNPDNILITAASESETISPGLPIEFLESIDLDAGTF
jgi:hypothetical protein